MNSDKNNQSNNFGNVKYYNKFVNFLKRNNLYDEDIFNFFITHATFTPYDIDETSFNNETFSSPFKLTQATNDFIYIYFGGNLHTFYPATPALNDERAVLYNILAYIKTFILLSRVKIDEVKDEDEVVTSTLKMNCSVLSRAISLNKKEDTNELYLLFYYGLFYQKNNPNLRLTIEEIMEVNEMRKNASPKKKEAYKRCKKAIYSKRTNFVQEAISDKSYKLGKNFKPALERKYSKGKTLTKKEKINYMKNK